jgi:RES domain-containing protein
MKYFRIFEALPGRSPLGYGIGAGRWNLYGTPVIYACSHCSLNFLEMLSIKGPIVSISPWDLVTFEIEGEIPHLHPEDLPADWLKRPYPSSTQEIGTAWVRGMISPFLKVPSCRIPISHYPSEHNLLINPLHAEVMGSLKVLERERVSFEIKRWK